MYATKYDSKADKWNILQILKRRELKLSLAEELPEVGFVVYEEDFFIAAGFLRKCEGGYGMMDSYITDPKMPPLLRNQALDMITKRLVKAAKSLQMKQVVGFCLDGNTISRSQRHGFVLTEHKVIVKAV